MMRRLLSISPLLLLTFLFAPAQAHAATIVLFGTTNASDATATADYTLTGNTLNLSLTNTSPYSAAITGFGLDLVAGDTGLGNDGIDGFSGTSVLDFDFTDGNVGNIPGYNGTVLDFGFLTGNNFNGGSANDGIAPGETLGFMVTGPFGGLTDAQIAAALFVRFQRVGPNGRNSDVATGSLNPTPVPEPASMLLLGGGLAAIAARRRRMRNNQIA
ncbi:MAG: cistern family PEP-CTERM protein [Acidobacteriota bacterium]|nr:cistern family PEP-CTERM protein [Acidobacteriota bacterium]